jgi:hypothetical protein
MRTSLGGGGRIQPSLHVCLYVDGWLGECADGHVYGYWQKYWNIIPKLSELLARYIQ